MVYIKVNEHGIYSSPIKNTRRGCRVSLRWVGHIKKSRSGYKARLMRSCSPLELTAVSRLVASLNGE